MEEEPENEDEPAKDENDPLVEADPAERLEKVVGTGGLLVAASFNSAI